MSFEDTKKEIKKVPFLAVVSYSTIVLLMGFVLKEVSGLGNVSYAVTTIGLPLVASHVDRFTDGNLMKVLRKDWIALSPITHILIITDCLIIFNFIKILTTKNLLWFKKIAQNL